MFGAIGHARFKPGQQARFAALDQEWRQTIRPQIPGPFVQLVGHAAGRPNELVFVALAQDEPTYRALAAMPAQDTHYRRLLALLDGEVRWEDVELDLVAKD